MFCCNILRHFYTKNGLKTLQFDFQTLKSLHAVLFKVASHLDILETSEGNCYYWNVIWTTGYLMIKDLVFEILRVYC